MDVYGGLSATVGLGTTLWDTWRSLRTFLDDVEHVDEMFLELQQRVTLLHSALLSVDAAASARSRAYKQNGQEAKREERLIVQRICESRAHCKTTITQLRETIESIKPSGSRISHSEFIRKFHEQWKMNERKPAMAGFLETIDTHLQTQQLFLVCLLSLGQTGMDAVCSEVRSLIDEMRQQYLPDRASLPSPPDSPASARSFPASISGGGVADPVYTGLMTQALPQHYVDNAESEIRLTMWEYAVSVVQRNDVSILEQVLERNSDIIKLKNADGWTLFHQAVQSLADSGGTASLECLVQHLPKEQDTESSVIDAQCKTGKTPVFFAVEQRYPKALQLLVKARANINIADYDGLTPLGLAHRKSYFDIIDILIKSGANVDEEVMKDLNPTQRKLLLKRDGKEQNNTEKAKRKESFRKVPSQELGSDIQASEPKQLGKSLSFRIRRLSRASTRRSSTLSTLSTADTIVETRRASCCSNCGQQAFSFEDKEHHTI